jgi:hypothetical protein
LPPPPSSSSSSCSRKTEACDACFLSAITVEARRTKLPRDGGNGVGTSRSRSLSFNVENDDSDNCSEALEPRRLSLCDTNDDKPPSNDTLESRRLRLGGGEALGCEGKGASGGGMDGSTLLLPRLSTGAAAAEAAEATDIDTRLDMPLALCEFANMAAAVCGGSGSGRGRGGGSNGTVAVFRVASLPFTSSGGTSRLACTPMERQWRQRWYTSSGLVAMTAAAADDDPTDLDIAADVDFEEDCEAEKKADDDDDISPRAVGMPPNTGACVCTCSK